MKFGVQLKIWLPCSGNTCKPIVKNADIERGNPALVADLKDRGVWDMQSAASFDIRVTDTDTPSHLNSNLMSLLSSAEKKKKK